MACKRLTQLIKAAIERPAIAVSASRVPSVLTVLPGLARLFHYSAARALHIILTVSKILPGENGVQLDIMKRPKHTHIDCVVNAGSGCSEEDAARLTGLGSIMPLKTILGADAGGEPAEVSEGIVKAVQQSILLGQADPEESWEALGAARRMIDAMNEQVRVIELDIQMLNLRKKALKRRTRILEKLAESLDGYTSDRKAA